MSLTEQQQRRLIHSLAALFAAACVGGAVQSWRVANRLPAVDLFEAGAIRYVRMLNDDGDVDGAIEQLALQAKILPFDATTREELGIQLGNLKRPEEAREQFEQLVKIRPEHAPAWHLLGSTYLDTNQPDDAVSSFTRAVRLDPQFAQAFNGLGVAYAQLGRLSDAERYFAEAVRLKPDFTDAQINLNRAAQELGQGARQ